TSAVCFRFCSHAPRRRSRLIKVSSITSQLGMPLGYARGFRSPLFAANRRPSSRNSKKGWRLRRRVSRRERGDARKRESGLRKRKAKNGLDGGSLLASDSQTARPQTTA